jgi:hypothetical protein
VRRINQKGPSRTLFDGPPTGRPFLGDLQSKSAESQTLAL